jgi:hypothetical protein
LFRVAQIYNLVPEAHCTSSTALASWMGSFDPSRPHFVELNLQLSDPLELDIQLVEHPADDLATFVEQINQTVVFLPCDLEALGFSNAWDFTANAHNVRDVYTRARTGAVRIRSYGRLPFLFLAGGLDSASVSSS